MVNSKYIINLENYFVLNQEVVLVMEYAKGGELKQYLNQVGRFSEYRTQQYTSQIINGLGACH